MKFTGITAWKAITPILNVFLFAIYPVLVLYAHNVDELVFEQLFLPIIFSLVLSTIFFGFWLIILKNSVQASLATVILLIIFWNYGLFYTGISKLVSLKTWHLIPILFFVYFHLVYFIIKIKHHKTLNKLNIILLLPISLLIIINVITILPSEFRKFNSIRIKYQENRQQQKANAGKYYPDIYLIILDEYASLKTIKDEWGYDNDGFAGYLRKEGFYVAEKSEHRYIQTMMSMSSLLNLEYISSYVDKNDILKYHYEPDKIRKTKIFDELNKISDIDKINKWNNNYAVNYLKRKGYKIIVLEGISQHYSSVNFQNADFTFSYQDVNKSDRFRFLVDAFYMELINKSIILPFNMFFKIDQTSDINYAGTKYILKYLKDAVNQSDSPKFIYAHIMCPHIPYVFDREGNQVSFNLNYKRQGNYLTPNNSVNKAYLEQYIYITNEIENVVYRHVHGKDQIDRIFIILNDHGPRPHLQYLKDKTYAFKAFNAVYFPDGNYRNLYDSIAPVNTLRVVLNKYFGENFKMLEDK